MLLGLAAAVLLHRPRTASRLVDAMPRAPAQPAQPRPDRFPQVACAAAGLALALLLTAPAGFVLGLAVGVGGPRLLLRQPGRSGG